MAKQKFWTSSRIVMTIGIGMVLAGYLIPLVFMGKSGKCMNDDFKYSGHEFNIGTNFIVITGFFLAVISYVLKAWDIKNGKKDNGAV